MSLSYDVISEFVKITNDKKEKPKEETVYATIVQTSDGKYVKIDGSDLVTPTETTTDIEDGERVTVLIKDHSAIITGNITSPSASGNRVNGIVDVVNEKLGVFETIVADKIDVNELHAYKAEIEHLIANKAEINDLKANTAEIKVLTAEFANIKTLVNGNLTSDNILAFHITSDKVTMEDAFIKDAMIATVNAAKINTGQLNTNMVSIGSSDGSMLINGSTQQFKDKNGNVRIQIGKDSTGDFTFVLYGEDGEGQIINQNGITASAVSDGLIVNDMVNDNAAISGGKLDISSVIAKINEDNSTTIQSSKIFLDQENQSLEVAFGSLKTHVDTIQNESIDGTLADVVEKTQSNLAQITANAEGIQSLVSQSEIAKSEINDMKNEFKSTSTELSNKYTTLNQSLDGFKIEAADTFAKKTTVEDLENNLSTNYTTTEAMNSAIEMTAGKVALSVSETKIKNMKLGGVNLLLESDDKRQLDKPETSWNSISYNLIDEYANLTLENDTTFVLSFTVDRNNNFDNECFDTIAFDDGWHHRWLREDIDKITHVKDSTFKFVMKPKTLPKGTCLADKLSIIGEHEYGGGAFYNVMLVEGDTTLAWSLANQDIQNSIANIDIKTDSITSEVSKIEKSMAIDNLLANGNFTNGLTNWTYMDHGAPINYTLTTNTEWTMGPKTALLLQCSNHPQGYDSGFTQTVAVKRNTNYTFTGYIASHRAEGMAIIKDAEGNWLVYDKTNADDWSYTGGDDITKWKRIRLVVTTGERDQLKFHLAMGTSGENGHVWFHDFMLTEGDTDLCWKPSQRETRTQINQLSDRITTNVSSIEMVNGKVNTANSQIDILADRMTSAVSSIEKVDVRVSNTNSRIDQLSDSITSEVSKIEKSMAIDNLLANGNFTNGLTNWTYMDHGAPINYTLTTNTEWTMGPKTALLLQCSNHPQGYDSGFTQTVAVKRNTNYTFTGYIASHRAEGMAIIKDAEGNWLVYDKTNADDWSYTGGDDITKWKRIRLVVTTGERDQLKFHLAMGTSYNEGCVWLHDFMVTEGDTDLCWKPSERETRTRIDQLSDRITSTVSSIETVDGKINRAQSQIDQQANQIASKVNSGDLSSLIQQNSSSIYAGISSGRGVHGVGIDTSGLYCFNNNLVTARLTEGKFHAYNSWNGNHMGYFGTNGDDLRACIYGTNTFSIYSNDSALLLRARYNRDASYGNATLDMCGGINFIHKPGQDVGVNQILLGNDDRNNAYGYHNMSIRCWNTLGFQDNCGLTNMFFDVRRGRIIMKGGLYQNTGTVPAAYVLSNDEENPFYSGVSSEQMVNSILNLETTVKVDTDDDLTMMILPNDDDLAMTIIGEQPHIDIASIVAGLVETVKSLNNRIQELENGLNKSEENNSEL